MYLIDTNIWLSLFLEEANAGEVEKLFRNKNSETLFITEFSIYSIGIILTQLKKESIFEDFMSDTLVNSSVNRIILDIENIRKIITIRKQFQLSFDDAYQYVAADNFNLTIVSFDKDFDRTERGRKTPDDVLKS